MTTNKDNIERLEEGFELIEMLEQISKALQLLTFKIQVRVAASVVKTDAATYTKEEQEFSDLLMAMWNATWDELFSIILTKDT